VDGKNGCQMWKITANNYVEYSIEDCRKRVVLQFRSFDDESPVKKGKYYRTFNMVSNVYRIFGST